MSDHKLKVGDKIKLPFGYLHDVLEVEGGFALVRGEGTVFPILFHDGAWRSSQGGPAWTVVKPRWRAGVRGSTTVVYDGSGRDGDGYVIALWDDDTNLTRSEVAEAVEAIVELLNERFPA